MGSPSEPDDRNADRVLTCLRTSSTTRAARSASSTTSATGYSGLGAPEGRYFAPANSADASNSAPATAPPRTILVRQPFFTRFDIGLTKRFPIKNQVNFELRFDVLNVFDNINFVPHSVAATTCLAPARTSSRPTGLPGLQQPVRSVGGWLGQVVFRLNW